MKPNKNHLRPELMIDMKKILFILVCCFPSLIEGCDVFGVPRLDQKKVCDMLYNQLTNDFPSTIVTTKGWSFKQTDDGLGVKANTIYKGGVYDGKVCSYVILIKDKLSDDEFVERYNITKEARLNLMLGRGGVSGKTVYSRSIDLINKHKLPHCLYDDDYELYIYHDSSTEFINSGFGRDLFTIMSCISKPYGPFYCYFPD